MNAGPVLGKLIRGNVVSLHVLRVRVTAGAGLRHVQGVYCGPSIAGGAKVVHAVTVDAYCYLGITLREEFSVHAGLVLAQLIGAQRWVVLAHERPIRMATPAELRDILSFDLPAKSGSFAHGIHICLCGITTVATRACETLLRVNVAGELLFGHLQRGIESPVAIQAGVLRLSRSRAAAEGHPQQQAQPRQKFVISPRIHR